jgi:hypothetical protein
MKLFVISRLYCRDLDTSFMGHKVEGTKNPCKKRTGVRHVTGTGSGLLGGIPRVVVQISALTLKGPL